MLKFKHKVGIVFPMLCFTNLTLPSSIPRSNEQHFPNQKRICARLGLTRVFQTENEGNNSSIYDSCKRESLKISSIGNFIFKAFGFYGKIPSLAPIRKGKGHNDGKNVGAAIFFIRRFHECTDISSVVKEFSPVVPVLGVVSHEVYASLPIQEFKTRILEAKLVELLFSKKVYDTTSLELSPSEEIINLAVGKFKAKKFDIQKDSFVDFVENYYKDSLNETFPLHYYAILQNLTIANAIETENYRVDENRHEFACIVVTLLLNGLKITNTLAFNSSATTILNLIPDLKHESYLLSFPKYDESRKLCGLNATAFIINESETCFYDPCGLIGFSSNPRETIGKFFDHYKCTDATTLSLYQIAPCKNKYLLHRPQHEDSLKLSFP